MNDLAIKIKNYIPDENELTFWWLGQQGFIFKTRQSLSNKNDDKSELYSSLTFAIDAFLSENEGRIFPPQIKAKELDFLDYVLGTHDHLDHIDREAWKEIAQVNNSTKFVIPALFMETLPIELDIEKTRFILLDHTLSYLSPIANKQSMLDMKRSQAETISNTSKNAPPIKITAVPAAHEFLDKDPNTGMHPYLCYIIDINGFRIFHAGDTLKYEGLETLLKDETKLNGRYDLMFLPINGRDGSRLRENIVGNMSAYEAVDLAGAIKPRFVIPTHYDMFQGNTEDPIKFIDYLRVKFPFQKWLLPERGNLMKLLPHD